MDTFMRMNVNEIIMLNRTPICSERSVIVLLSMSFYTRFYSCWSLYEYGTFYHLNFYCRPLNKVFLDNSPSYFR